MTLTQAEWSVSRSIYSTHAVTQLSVLSDYCRPISEITTTGRYPLIRLVQSPVHVTLSAFAAERRHVLLATSPAAVDRYLATRHDKEIMQGTMPGARRRGRPRTAWMDNIKTWTGLPVEESTRMTEDRDKWRKSVRGVADPRIEDG